MAALLTSTSPATSASPEADVERCPARRDVDARFQASKPDTAYLAGGTDLLQLGKSGAMTPAAVVDISRLPLNEVKFSDGRLALGALARLSDVAVHPDVVHHHPFDCRSYPRHCQRANPQHGDDRWQSAAANALPVFPQAGSVVRCEPVMRRHACLRPGDCAGSIGR
jgi:hypothetical protein